MITRAWIWSLAGAGSVLLGTALGRAQEQPPAPQPPGPPAPGAPAPTPPAEKPKTDAPPAPGQPDPSSPPAPAPQETSTEVVVYLKDGKSLQGLLVRDDKNELVIKIAGIETPISALEIDHYQPLPPILERYRQYRASIGEDPEQILALAGWLQAREQFELGVQEVERVLAVDPHNTRAQALKTALKSQIELRQNARSRAGTPHPAPKPTGNAEPREADQPEPFPLLNEAQINLIKVFEIDLNNPPRLIIPRETIAKLLEKYAGSPLVPVTQEGRDALYRKPAVEVLELMFKLKARDFYGQVQVLDQPTALRLFRDEVQAGWLVNSCATSACHGGKDAGRLMLVNRKPRSEASAYTNFIILDRFHLADGTALINYDDPAKSPLVQMSLPRQDALYKHPEVPRGPRGHDVWRALFRNQQERGFTRTVEWIKTLYRPRPDYPIEYRPPRPSDPPTLEKKEPVPR